MDKNQIILTVLAVFCIALVIWAIFYTRKQKKAERDTQRIITDLALLRLFEKSPGGLLSSSMVADQTGLTNRERINEEVKQLLYAEQFLV